MCDGKGLPPGVSPGYRRIDHVIGIVAELYLGDKLLKTEASSPAVLKKHRQGTVKE